MKRILLVTTVLAVALAVVTSASFAVAPKLIGKVGPGYTISLKSPSGKPVKVLKRGTYSITVVDKARAHNFVLEGPGVEREITRVGFKGTKTVTVKLRAGKYKFYCRPHESSMFGYFTVS